MSHKEESILSTELVQYVYCNCYREYEAVLKRRIVVTSPQFSIISFWSLQLEII